MSLSGCLDDIFLSTGMKLQFKNQKFQSDAAKAVTDSFVGQRNLFELFKQKCGWSDAEVKNNVKVI